jgi:hypothetical protein
MADPLPPVIANPLQIAWDYLDGSGEIADPQQTAEFLIWSIRGQILRGERRPFALSNRAIGSFFHQRPIKLA